MLVSSWTALRRRKPAFTSLIRCTLKSKAELTPPPRRGRFFAEALRLYTAKPRVRAKPPQVSPTFQRWMSRRRQRNPRWMRTVWDRKLRTTVLARFHHGRGTQVGAPATVLWRKNNRCVYRRRRGSTRLSNPRRAAAPRCGDRATRRRLAIKKHKHATPPAASSRGRGQR